MWKCKQLLFRVRFKEMPCLQAWQVPVLVSEWPRSLEIHKLVSSPTAIACHGRWSGFLAKKQELRYTRNGGKLLSTLLLVLGGLCANLLYLWQVQTTLTSNSIIAKESRPSNTYGITLQAVEAALDCSAQISIGLAPSGKQTRPKVTDDGLRAAAAAHSDSAVASNYYFHLGQLLISFGCSCLF